MNRRAWIHILGGAAVAAAAVLCAPQRVHADDPAVTGPPAFRGVTVSSGGMTVGTQMKLNFINAAGLTWNITNNTGSKRIDITATINASQDFDVNDTTGAPTSAKLAAWGVVPFSGALSNVDLGIFHLLAGLVSVSGAFISGEDAFAITTTDFNGVGKFTFYHKQLFGIPIEAASIRQPSVGELDFYADGATLYLRLLAAGGGLSAVQPFAFNNTASFPLLSASRPLKLNGSKQVTAAAIDLSGAEVTGTLADSHLADQGGVAAGTYTNADVTVDSKGRVIAISSGSAGGGSGSIEIVDQFRLSVSSGVYLSTGEVVSTRLYLGGVKGGKQISIPTGSNHGVYTATTTQLSITNAGLSADAIYDVFVKPDLTLGFSAAWSTWTVRTDQISTTTGVGFPVMTSTPTYRWLGIVRTDSDTKFVDTLSREWVTNGFNKVRRYMYHSTNNNEWSTTSSSIRAANNDHTIRLEVLSDDDGNDIDLTTEVGFHNACQQPFLWGIGLDRENGNDSTSISGEFGATGSTQLTPRGRYLGKVALGYHYFQVIEATDGGCTDTVLGDNYDYGNHGVWAWWLN